MSYYDFMYNPHYPWGFNTQSQPTQIQSQPMPNAQSQPTANNNGGIIWVQGEAGAKSYLVAPNTTVQLWDSESQRIYLKSTDASGMPSMKVLEYTILDDAMRQPNNDKIEYATKEDVNAVNLKLTEFEKKLKELLD